MTEKDFKYIYGPVSSWRLGISLGIDLLSQKAKICSFDCIYCQLGKRQAYTSQRKLYVPTKDVIRELKILPDVQIDYITFSGRGEPTLAENLGQTIKAVKKIRKENIAVLTNSSLIDRKDVRKELTLADFVVAKLDAYSQESFKEINKPAPKIKFDKILDGLKQFRKDYRGKLALQIMFMAENKHKCEEILYLVNYIKPDEVQVNTPLRPCSVKPLSKQEITKIKEYFSGRCVTLSGGKRIKPISVYATKAYKYKEVVTLNDKAALKRRGQV